MRQAKIQLIADVQAFKDSLSTAKNILKDLGEVDIGSKNIDGFKDKLEKSLSESADRITEKIGEIKTAMIESGKEGGKAFDSEELSGYLRNLSELQKSLKDIKSMQSEINKEGVSPKVEGGTNLGGLATKGGRGIMRAAAAVGLTMGIGASISRGSAISRERTGVRSLTGGGLGDETAGIDLGFGTDEFRQREAGVARAAGRKMGDEELTKSVVQTMKVERAYGVDNETQNSLMTASRKAGVKDQTKFLGDSIGVAVAAGLDGSRISEFLSASANYLSEMSKGINIDGQSLKGFAGALSSIPFFAQDPERSFNAIRSLDKTFQSGDQYQRTLASRAILNENPNASVGAVELRRKMGLFGTIDEDTRSKLSKTDKGKELLKTLDIDAPRLISNMFKDAMSQTKGLADEGNRAFALGEALGLSPAATMAIVANGGDVSQKDVEAMKKAQMSPEDRIAETFKGQEKSMMQFTSKMTSIVDQMAMTISGPITKLAELLPLNTKELANVGVGLTALSTIMALLPIKGLIDIIKTAGGAGAAAETVAAGGTAGTIAGGGAASLASKASIAGMLFLQGDSVPFNKEEAGVDALGGKKSVLQKQREDISGILENASPDKKDYWKKALEDNQKEIDDIDNLISKKGGRKERPSWMGADKKDRAVDDNVFQLFRPKEDEGNVFPMDDITEKAMGVKSNVNIPMAPEIVSSVSSMDSSSDAPSKANDQATNENTDATRELTRAMLMVMGNKERMRTPMGNSRKVGR